MESHVSPLTLWLHSLGECRTIRATSQRNSAAANLSPSVSESSFHVVPSPANNRLSSTSLTLQVSTVLSPLPLELFTARVGAPERPSALLWRAVSLSLVHGGPMDHQPSCGPWLNGLGPRSFLCENIWTKNFLGCFTLLRNRTCSPHRDVFLSLKPLLFFLFNPQTKTALDSCN